ncbi:MAG: DNA translocase FtsK 4TM domain-containing protein [Acidobacteriota bacterium]
MTVREFLDVPRAREAAGIFLFGLALLVMLALGSYAPSDPSFFAATAQPSANWAGPIGAQISALLYETVGLSAWFLPLMLIAGALRRLRMTTVEMRPSAAVGLTMVAASTAILLTLLVGEIHLRGATLYAGGAFGKLFSDLSKAVLSEIGSMVVMSTILLAGMALAARSSLAESTAEAARIGKQVPRSLWGVFGSARPRLRSVWSSFSMPRLRWPWRRSAAPLDEPAIRDGIGRSKRSKLESSENEVPARARAAVESEVEDEPDDEVELAPHTRRKRSVAKSGDQAVLPVHLPPPSNATKLPPTTLLSPAAEKTQVNRQEVLAIARQIESRCAEFAVDGQVLEIHPGPVVTTFEFRPNAGIKLNRITNLADDLALALEAESVRIERIPGRPTVGIEVPNRQREKIALREVLESEVFKRPGELLTLGLGKSQEGDIFVTSLAKMPHLLIAGSTGAGKSVGLNTIITSILYRARPDEVKFVMIDPKMLELGLYDGIPHQLVPVVTDMKLAANALKWAVREMERRYRLLASCNVRHLDGFNQLVHDKIDVVERAILTIPHRAQRDKFEAKRLPYIVIVVDELADLLMTTGNETEECIARLAQKARAVGIHLVLATQRPSVDILTGAIKANFPARIAFRCASKIDSRTILDASGSERLLGAGDMLYRPPGSARLIRVHGAYISEEEGLNIVTWLKSQARCEYDKSVLEDPQETNEGGESGEAGGGFNDPVYRQAVRLVVATGQASTSFLQRKMRLGYSRAARIVDQMEEEGIVGPADGAKPRQLMVGPEFLERMDQQDEDGPSA